MLLLKFITSFLLISFYSQIKILHDPPSTQILALQEDEDCNKPQKEEENENQKDAYKYEFSKRPQNSCQIPGTAEITGKTFSSSLITKELTVNEKLQVEGDIQSKSVNSKEIHAQSIQLDTLTSLNGVLSINGNLYINSMTIENSIQARSFLLNDIRQWQIIKHDDFESDESLKGWNFTERSSCDNLNYFLGGHCKLSNQEVCKTFHIELPHTAAKLSAYLHILDDWDKNEYIFLKINQSIVWVSVIESEGIVNFCGEPSPDIKLAQPVEYQFDHNSTEFKVCFGSSLPESSDHCKASFGIDDVIVEIK